MSALFIPGQAAPHTPLLHDKFIQVEALQSITTDSRRSGAETHELDEAGDVVLLEFEGGIQQWILREEIEEVLGVESSRGSERVLSLRRRRKSGRRGVKDWVLKGLKVFKVDLKGVAAEAVAKIVDRKMCSEPGLMQGFPKPGQLGPAQTNLPTDNPLLLFIHGTFSNSVLGYAGLTEPEQAGAWKALTDQYSHAPLFFNHPTFSKSPVENALDLVEQLPKSARLHLVSHSRGGLVGDLLCLGDEKAQEHLTSEVLGTVPRLDELCRLLKEKQIVVEKFVRVACPARGTLLASERLDVYLNVILNLVTRMTGLNGPYSTLIRSFLLAVIRRRNDASRIPGIEAMVPGSPLVKLLNGLPVSLGSELTVLAGDVEGAGFAGNLKVFTADSFFLEDHDLVVDTKSMYGGLKRDQSFFYFRSGSDVDHLNYFRTPDFVDALRRGLGDLTAAPVNLRPLTAGRRGLFSRPLSKPTGARPGVFILPGIMGSHLQLGQNRIWLDPFSLGIGGFRKLDNFEEVSSEAVVDSHYGDLARYLDKTHDVYLWHYDWRISVLENGRRLAKDMKAALRKSASSQQSLGIIAHSMGGLVVRAMLAQKPEVWDEACKRPNSRIVFLGTPHSGSLQILRVLSGDENIVRGLYAVDMFGSRADYTSLLGKFPGVVQLLPSEHGQHDFSKLQTWKKLQNADGHLTIPPNSVRDEASALWDKLNNNDLWQRDNVTYVAGWARSTPSNIKVENGKLKFFSTGRGDGRVLWAGGVLEDDKKNYYAQVSHGKLPDFRKAFSGYKDLLERGETSHALLSKQPPVGLRGDDREWEEVDRPLAIHPEESDLMAFAMGDDDEGPRDASLPELPLNVRVVHGDLTFARYPVMLGHYSDDVIVGAEGVLDRHLNGALRLRRMKGVYPGTEGTTLVLLRPESDVPGAIIIGLGDVGNLSAGSLGQALERGVKEYVMRLSEEERTDTPQELGITTILIGSGESGIPLSESLSTLIESVLTANRSLRGTDGTESRVIQRLDVIELYEDVATEAAHLLRMLQSEPRFSGRLEIETQLQTSPGRLRRAYSVTDSGWWRRLQVKTRENGPGLIYQTFLERARAESYEVGVGQDAIEQFTRTVETDPNYRPEISVTLFELMVPNQVKYFASGRHNILLQLDSQTASLPWEMLRDRTELEGQPMAVRSGMIRQLLTEKFRSQVDHPNTSDVLVIGDPPTHLAPLPGARAEAVIVSSILSQNGFQVTELIARPPSESLPELVARDYRLLHFSGHGEYDPEAKEAKGMVLGDHFYLSPAMINQMRTVPEFVFINCCHLGSMERPRHRGPLAANLAEQFIRMGVRAVIAAGWAVADDAANLFAQEFYAAMLRGSKFGKAVLTARQATYDSFAFDTTWGAFQAYGDPDYRFWKGEDTNNTSLTYVSPREPIVACQNLAEGAETASSEDLKWRRDQFLSIENAIPAEWMKNSELLAALGTAAAELTGALHGFAKDDPFHRKARDYFDAALVCPNAQLTFEKANLLEGIRLREAFFSSEPQEGAKIVKACIDRRELLAQFLDLDSVSSQNKPTGPEKKNQKAASRMGGGYFALAQLTGKNEELLTMVKYYNQANQIALSQTERLDPYCAHYELTGRIALKLRGSESKEATLSTNKVAKLLAECDRIAAEDDNKSPQFFLALVAPRGLLLRLLLEDKLSGQESEVVEGYRRAWLRDGTPYKFRSVLEYILFFEKLLPDADTVDRLTQMRVELSELVR